MGGCTMSEPQNEKAPSGQAEGFGKETGNRAGKCTAYRFTPRQRRLAEALAPGGWIRREDVDRIAGASNGPDVVAQLRRRVTGRDGIEMQMVKGQDRDGQAVEFGRYRMTAEGRRLAVLAGLLLGDVADGECA